MGPGAAVEGLDEALGLVVEGAVVVQAEGALDLLPEALVNLLGRDVGACDRDVRRDDLEGVGDDAVVRVSARALGELPELRNSAGTTDGVHTVEHDDLLGSDPHVLIPLVRVDAAVAALD